MLAWDEADTIFGTLQTVIIDELHAFIGTKRGDQLALALARLRRFQPPCVLLACRRRLLILCGFADG
jgi:Lhr-like helicase